MLTIVLLVLLAEVRGVDPVGHLQVIMVQKLIYPMYVCFVKY